MPFIVVRKLPPWPEMHVLQNGNLSQTGKPKKFISKEGARLVAAEWAQHEEDNGLHGTYAVRKVD